MPVKNGPDSMKGRLPDVFMTRFLYWALISSNIKGENKGVTFGHRGEDA